MQIQLRTETRSDDNNTHQCRVYGCCVYTLFVECFSNPTCIFKNPAQKKNRENTPPLTTSHKLGITFTKNKSEESFRLTHNIRIVQSVLHAVKRLLYSKSKVKSYLTKIELDVAFKGHRFITIFAPTLLIVSTCVFSRLSVRSSFYVHARLKDTDVDLIWSFLYSCRTERKLSHYVHVSKAQLTFQVRPHIFANNNNCSSNIFF